MTNKKSTLEQFVAFATNPVDNTYTIGTMPIAQAFKELSERVEALEAKQLAPVLVYEPNKEIKYDTTPMFVKMKDESRTIELPDDTFDPIYSGITETAHDYATDDCDDDGNHHWLKIGSTTFIRAKKAEAPEENKKEPVVIMCEKHDRIYSVNGSPMCAPCFEPEKWREHEESLEKDPSYLARRAKKGGDQ